MGNQWLYLGAQAVRHSRKLKIALIAGAALLVLLIGLAAWAAVALLGWLGGQAPSAWEAVKGQAPAVTRKIEEVAPGAVQAVEQWLPGKAAPKAEATKTDVAGEDLAGIARYPGQMRVRYAVEGTARSVVFAGPGPFRPVADHYAARFLEKGWKHRLLYADGKEERHEYQSPAARYELHIREADAGVTVTIREAPGAAQPK